MQDEPLGLGHAISLCKGFINNESFAVLLGDDLFKCQTPAIKQLIKKFPILDTILNPQRRGKQVSFDNFLIFFKENIDNEIEKTKK
ncbi:hypothetical protein Q8W57_04585, partial [Mycoplasma mycoides]|nr:hypothetical protein [Mycoplasma mycoides]